MEKIGGEGGDGESAERTFGVPKGELSRCSEEGGRAPGLGRSEVEEAETAIVRVNSSLSPRASPACDSSGPVKVEGSSKGL